MFPDMRHTSECVEGRMMGYAGRHNIYEGTIRRMVTQALKAHASDTDGQLIAYLRSSAMKLHHVPWPGEIAGGTVIAQRFGSWERALAIAKLPRPEGPNKSSAFLRVKQEEERQKEIYRQRKAEKKILAEQRKHQQEARKREKKE